MKSWGYQKGIAYLLILTLTSTQIAFAENVPALTQNNNPLNAIPPGQISSPNQTQPVSSMATTQEFFQNTLSLTPAAEQSSQTATGEKIVYSQDTLHTLKRYDASGNLLETIERPKPADLDESQAVRTTFEGGLETFSINGKMVEMRTQSGVRVTDFSINDEGEIQDALFVYPDSTREVIRNGKLLRRISPDGSGAVVADGSMLDFAPDGFIVREILNDHVNLYSYQKNQVGEIIGIKISAEDGSYVLYDEKGILREVHGSESKNFIYTREVFADYYKTSLDRTNSLAPEAKTLVEGHYGLDGSLQKMILGDGTQLFFESGRMARALDANGNNVDYTYLENQAGVEVARGNIQFQYDRSGFLEKIVTDAGTIRRQAADTNHNGVLTDEQLINIILDEAGGNHLSDFELDGNGKILNGILETKEGIKQTIQNGILTRFETVDGRLYEMRNKIDGNGAVVADGNREAVLKEWNFNDGTRVLFGGGAITEILFPDGKRLHTIGFDQNREVDSFIEEQDGIKKVFIQTTAGSKEYKLDKLITATGVEINYGKDGWANEIVLTDGSEQAINYLKDENGQIREISFIGRNENRTFDPDGTLIKLLDQGVNVEMDNEAIKKLFTRFGVVESPQFNENGALTGNLAFSDGAKLVVSNGELIQAVRPNGTKVNFMAGRIVSIETEKGKFQLIYQEARNGNLEGIRIRLASEEGSPEFPLIPFLQDPDTLIESVKGTKVSNPPLEFHGNAGIVTNDSKSGTSSAVFDGSGDFLTAEHNSDFEFGTGDWTIDFWAKFNEQSREYVLYQKGDHTNGGIAIHRHAGINRWDIFVAGNRVISVNSLIQTGKWCHVALLRSGNKVRLFQDGIEIGNVDAGPVNVTNKETLFIGANAGWGAFPGQIDEFRVSKGIARWTGNFIPAQEAYKGDAYTKLLLDFEPPKQEISKYAKSVEELSQILFSQPLYNSLGDRSRIESILKTKDKTASANVHPFTLQGDARLDGLHSVFGGTSSSFDGAGDYLTVNHATDFELGTSDWTIDFRVRFDAQAREYVLYQKGDNTSNGIAIHRHAGINRWDIFLAGNRIISVNSIMKTGQWYHVALARSGSTVRLYQDGVQIGSVSAGTMNVKNTESLRIGSLDGWGSFPGQMDELRVSNAARWTSNFTVPAAEYARDANTVFLLHFSEAEFKAKSEVLPPPIIDPNKKDPGQELFFAKFVLDPQRGTAYEFAKDFMPEWLNMSLDEVTGGGGFIERGIHKGESDSAADLTAALIDLDGDGLQDRVSAPMPSTTTASLGENYWWFEKNNGQGFEKGVKWAGVNTAFNSYTIRETAGPHPVFSSELIDMNGDKRPDRVLTAYNDSVWRVQLNNGAGFDPIQEWKGQTQVLSFYTPEGKYAVESRFDMLGGDIQDLQSALIDLDGDGLPDRVVRPMPAEGQNPQDHWFFQKNTGNGFADAVLWKGVDWSFYPNQVGVLYSGDAKAIGASLSWYHGSVGTYNMFANMADLVDINGDHLPDRILLKPKNPSDNLSAMDWYVQFNNGKGFDSAVLWDNTLRAIPNIPAAYGTSIQLIDDINQSRRYLSLLRDVTGDGFPDRITMPARSSTAQGSWWVEVNNGKTFLPAVEWKGIDGKTAIETAVSQDNDLYHLNRNTPADCSRVVPCSFQQTVDLTDINGDGILDRVIFRPGESKWLVQFGTGSGFLPGEEMKIEGLAAATNQIRSSRYDYLHASLKAASNLPASLGKVRVTLGDENRPDSFQEWKIENLITGWQDFYLPLDRTKNNASGVKIEFIPAAEDPNIAIYVDNISFTALRPPAVNDWLDRLLTESNTLSEINSESSKTLAQYIGLTRAEQSVDFNWDKVLKAETKIEFKLDGNAQKFETLYGSVTKIENGKVLETVLPNGTKIEFSTPSPDFSSTLNQKITHEDGTVETVQNAYGRVRSVSRPQGSPLEYSYEFTGSGEEITGVHDPDSGISERYVANRLISRTAANGVVTAFEYNTNGELVQTSLIYKGRVRQTFKHSLSKSGNKIITTEEGIQEEYDVDGKILYHTTPEGYKYAHNFEKARRVVTKADHQTITFADGSTLSVDVPIVTLEDNPDGEDVHRVELVSFNAPNGEYAEYDKNIVKSLTLKDGTKISFDKIETKKVADPETKQEHFENHLLDATVFHADGTITEFRNGKPSSVISATGHVISLEKENNLLINPNESAIFHDGEAAKIWNQVVNAKWLEYQPPATLPIQTEYSAAVVADGSAAVVADGSAAVVADGSAAVVAGGGRDGVLLTREYAEGVIELYENGRISEIVSREGERLIRYEYDAEGNPTKIALESSRRNLNSAVLKLRAEIAVQREEALARIADRQLVISETVEGEYRVTRDNLLRIRIQLEGQRNQVASIDVKGKLGKAMLGDAVSQIQVGLDQVNGALEKLAKQRIEALEKLAQQVKETSVKVEAETQTSYAKIETENQKARNVILKQEISPIVYHWYRKILGRDPNKGEYDTVIAQANYVSGFFDLEALKAKLRSSSELSVRATEVQAIKTQVKQELLHYLTLSESEQILFAQTLGVMLQERISLSSSEAQAILDWLEKRSLHFGQSAYLALEALLANAGITYQRVDLAKKLILIDVLTGTLTPMEREDLVLSIYALKRVAAGYGLETHALALDYETLKATYNDSCGFVSSVSCNFRVIAHINGNHFVVITKVTDKEITYTDPGAGPENALEVVILSKDEFLRTWVDPRKPSDGFGYVLSARPPPLPLQPQAAGGNAPETQVSGITHPHYSFLSTSEQMSIRGAFFFFLIPIFIAIYMAIASVVTAVITAVTTLITSLLAGIGSILSGVGSFFGGLLTGNILGGLQGLFSGVFAGLGQIVGGVGLAGLKLGAGFVNAFTALHGGLLLGIQGFAAQVPFFGGILSTMTGTSAFSYALGGGLLGLTLQGTASLLDAVGIAPKISQTIISGGKIVIGVGLLATGNPMGLGFVAGGTSELLNLHTNLSPTVAGIIGLSAAAVGAFAGGGFNAGSLSGAITGLKTALPYLAKDFASAGVVAVGSTLGLAPRLTSLLAIPVSAGFGVGLDSLTHANTINSTSIFAAIKNGLAAGAKSIGFDFSGKTTDAVFGSLKSGNILGSIESALGKSGLFSNVLDVLKQTALTPFNAVSGAVSAVLKGVTDFGSVIQTKGIAGAFESLASSIFSRETIEKLLGSGGLGGVLSSAAKVLTNLPGLSLPETFPVQEQKLSDTASLFYDLAGKFIGKKENGITQIGTFGVDAFGRFGLLAGRVIAAVLGDFVFAAEISSGQFMRGDIIGADGARTISIEGGPGPIVINGPNSPQSQSPSFWNMLFKFLPAAMDFFFDRGSLKKAEVSILNSNQQISGQSDNDKYLYLLANGVNNSKNINPLDDLLRKVFGSIDESSQPAYLHALRSDLNNLSHQEIKKKDVVMSSLFWNIPFDLNQWGEGDPLKWLDRIKDAMRMLIGTQTPLRVMSPLVFDLTSDINLFANRNNTDVYHRPLIGLGYSGGFPVLAEAVAQMGLNIKGLVGVGAALISLDELLDVIKQLGIVFEKIVGGAVDGIGNAIKGLFSKIPWVSKGVDFVIDKVIGSPVNGVGEALKIIQKYFREGVEKLKIENVIRMQSLIGIRKLQGEPIDAVLNIYGENDQLVEWGIGGEMSSVAGIPDEEVLNVEIKSPSLSLAKADHFIYMHGIRDYENAENLLPRQQEFDNASADFVADLMVKMRGMTKDDVISYLKQTYDVEHAEIFGNKVIFYPLGH